MVVILQILLIYKIQLILYDNKKIVYNEEEKGGLLMNNENNTNQTNNQNVVPNITVSNDTTQSINVVNDTSTIPVVNDVPQEQIQEHAKVQEESLQRVQ